MEKSKERLDVLKKIEKYEEEGLFDRDVENDPPSRALRANECDYLGKKLSSRLATAAANRIAKFYFDGCIRRGELVIREVRGIENYLAVAGRGAVITANHFNPYDNYAVYKAIEPHLGRHRLYKMIREGNYTSFGGLFGFFFRFCNTIPIPSTVSVWREMENAVLSLLERGEKILIYPEQGMWWNYKKPRPLKPGAFFFAAKKGAPVLPVFITMEDTERTGDDGFPIQAYTLHFLPAIEPQPSLSVKENSAVMAEKNYLAWKETYEDFYGIPLVYRAEAKV